MPNRGQQDNAGGERRIRDMLGLVKFCLETTSQEDAPATNQSIPPLDSERRQWLEEAIKSMTVDTTKLLLENLATVKETTSKLEQDPSHNICIPKTRAALEVLTDLCEQIDYAADFAKLEGFSIFKTLIGCHHEELIVKACELIAALAQNNPLCQDMALQTRLLERLLVFVDTEQTVDKVQARSFALYAISSIIRSNQDVRQHFESPLDGLEVLMRLLDHGALEKVSNAQPSSTAGDHNKKSSSLWLRKLKIRSIFLFRTLCAESPVASQFFLKRNAMSLLLSHLQNSHDPEIWEHLLNAIHALLLSLSQAEQITSLKSSPELRNAIQRLLETANQKTSADDYDLTDAKSTCKELITLIDSHQGK